jgi:glycosyltransferase involved in cell wall biosynthesis
MLQVIHISVGPLDIAGGIREVIRQLTPIQQSMGINPVVAGFCDDQAATGIDRQVEQHWLKPTGYRWFDRWRLYRLVRKLIKKSNDSTIVHAHELRASGEIALKLRKKLNVPYVVTVHIDPAHKKSELPGSALARRNRRRQVVREADGVVNVSEFIQSKTEILSPCQESPGQIRVTIYPAVTVPLLNSLTPIKIDRPYVLALGRLVHLKGFDSLIRAWAKTSIKNEWRLVIAGDGPDEGDFRKLVKEFELEDSVLFTGRVEGDVKWGWLKFAKMVAVTTHKIEEAFSLATLEAIHCSRPVVGYAGGGVQEMVFDGVDGLLVEPGNEDALAKAIDTLAGDEELLQKFSRQCREISERFTLETAAKKHVELYREIAGRGQH